ncbi:PVC-type heme-binding CxxCH protein [Rubritalea tangerina]|uniref:PVC-type heme-binding CxxCH protein n=1 Tax=Rubritalea tangerina TaxID=430798 RepID=A0ABW4ZEL6_9BACT
MNRSIKLTLLTTTGLSLCAAQAEDTYLTFQGDPSKPGKNKHIVLLAGDEEYRSEEAMPMLAQILSSQGFRCTVLFSMDANNKFVDPTNQASLSNPNAMKDADLFLMGLRFRNWDEKTMAKFDYKFKQGLPIVALRTSTHAFNIKDKNNKFHKYHWQAAVDTGWKGGFGKQVLGETWVNHHGRHAVEGTRTVVEEPNKLHPILNGVDTIFGKTDVYGVNVTQPATILLRGQVTKTLAPNSPAVAGKKNNPMMPVAWTRNFKQANGKTNKIFTTTMGSADDLLDENLRRLVINGVYWGLGMQVPKKADASLKNPYEPLMYGFNTFRKNRQPEDFISLESPETIRKRKLSKIKGKPGNVQFVRIELPGQGRILTLTEVEIISGGNNIAPKGTATQSSLLKPGTPEKAIDGNTAAHWGAKSMTHTAEVTDNPWWELNLGASYEVDAVKIFNRVENNFGERLNGLSVLLLDKDRKPILEKKYLGAPKNSMTITKSGSLSYDNGSYPAPEPPAPKVEGPKHPAVVKGAPPKSLQLTKNARLALIGGGLGSRMNMHHEFETELQRRYPNHTLFIRNLCKEGDTPAFRPHPSRNNHFVIPNGRDLVKEEFRKQGGGAGHYEMPDQWLERLQIDTVIGFFGYSESFDGLERIDGFKEELRAWIRHTLAQKYTLNGPQLAVVGPAAFEDLSATRHLPDGVAENQRIKAYSQAMAKVCMEEGVLYFDTFDFTKKLYDSSEDDQTQNGHNLTAASYKALAPALANGIFGKTTPTADYEKVKAAVAEKNRLWLLDYKIPNGVHVHGRRHKPFGNHNYPDELKKTRQMTAIRDQALWATLQNKPFDIPAADAKTITLKDIEPDGVSRQRGNKYLSGEDTLSHIKLPEGYKLQLFADEKRFPDLANPSQMAFDNQGRLWVGCMGSYPHYRIGDPLPNDKILIFEDTNGDGKADKQTAFVENIHIPMGFEITPQGGAYVSLGNDLVLLEDTNGDSKADKKTIVLSGFDDHDTHHAISAFCADPSGAIYMGEGVFSFSNVETPYGTVRGTNGGFYRFDPTKGKLERTAQYGIPNPWGIAFDDWGQNFFLHTSGPALSWMQQGAVKPLYHHNLKAPNILGGHNVRPTSGLEFVSSRHFPDEVQGDVIICNNIGFLGAKQHSVKADPNTGFFKVQYRQDLFVCDGAYKDRFRPVDLEFAPDGSLYFIDWSNALIGHMQHNARDPHRDHVHGRIYRITYPSRPLVKPAKIAGASIETLLDNLKLHESRSRYRTRRELRGRDVTEVTLALKKWVASLDKNDPKFEHHLLEALWVSWGLGNINTDLTHQLLKASDYRARTAAVRAVRYNPEAFSDLDAIMLKAIADTHPQVRHEALVSATWLGGSLAKQMLVEFEKQPVSSWSQTAYNHAKFIINQIKVEEKKPEVPVPAHIAKDRTASELYRKGFEHFGHGESCASCHQMKGEGVPNAFPPLAGSKWVTSDKDLLIKITLHGIMGEIDVKGKKYNGVMPGFAFRTPNKELAEVLTFVRNAFGNKAPDGDFVITEKDIERVLKATENQKGMMPANELLKAHPLKN